MDLSSEVPEDMTAEELRIELARARSERDRRTLLALPAVAAILVIWAIVPLFALYGGLPGPLFPIAAAVLIGGAIFAAWFVIHVTRSTWGKR